MKTSKWLICILTFLFFGCAGLFPKITPEGSRVRTITPGTASVEGCKFLGSTSARGVSLEGGMTAAMTKVKNQVGAAGANAMVITDRYIEEMGSARHGNVTVDVYRCDKQ